MPYLAISFVAAWSCGLLFLVAPTLTFIRLIYNNFLPGKTLGYPDYLRFYVLNRYFVTDANGIRSKSLTEVGRLYREKAIRNDWILLAWALGGFVLLSWASSYLS